jgi:acyl-CoA thioester hydrolase
VPGTSLRTANRRLATIARVIELGHVTDRKPPFRYAAYTRVGFSETDAQGVVYYGRYLPYFDLARTEYHRHLGRIHLGGADFAMRAANVEYHAPARFDDLLEVFVRIERIGTTSITYDHAAYRVADDGSDDLLLVTAKQTLVLIDLGGRRPVPVPEAFRERITAFEG